MAVAIDRHHITLAHEALIDDTIGHGGSIGDEERVIRAKGLCRLLLSLPQWTCMILQRPKFRNRDGQICSEKVFAKKLVERSADRGLGISCPAIMAWGVPRIGSFVSIL